ncbi:MAG TPA: DNA polymerase IV [Trueperaceae bacterium]|nr:DNA polymerase IV [Trueperaceae bacterium]
MTRKIVHVDMDAFFASVEQRDRPSIAGRPVAVGGSGPRSVVAAASYEARAYGVRSALPMARALRLCPELIVVPPRFSVYREVSTQVRGIFLRYTDLVEPLALDEAFLDVTQPRIGPPSATLTAQAIRAAIREETSLTASAGVAGGKFLAKVASGMNKPDGLTVITPAMSSAFLEALAIEKFFGVGPRTAEKMRALGIRTGAELKAAGAEKLMREFGKMGQFFHDMANGRDDRPVVPDRERKSISSETTFDEDLTDTDQIDEVLCALCEDVSSHMTRHGLAARTATVKLRYADFRTVTRSRTVGWGEVRDRDTLLRLARSLTFESERPQLPIRLLGVTVSHLGEDGAGPRQAQARLDFG